MLHLVVWPASILFVLLKGEVMNRITSYPLDTDLVVVFTAYLVAHCGRKGPGFFALSQGILTDIFSGGMAGLYSLIYLVVFLFVELGSRLFDLSSPRGLLIIVALAMMVKEALVLILLKGFHVDTGVSFPSAFLFLASPLATGLIAPPVIYLMDRLRRALCGEA